MNEQYMIKKSHKLKNVCYDIRGPVLDAANALENQGHEILKLNVGNPAQFGFKTPQRLVNDVVNNIEKAEGYCDSKGLLSAREAIYEYYQPSFKHLRFENIFIGNGVSELILMSMQTLLNSGDEILIPTPDYPLWSAAVNIACGKAVHYLCDEDNDWQPDIDDIKTKISKNTKGIVIINPNNPTGAVYSKELLLQIIEVARSHDLIIFSDEIYEKIVYDDITHTSIASLADDIFFITYNGLSKTYRAAGYRTGWMVLSGKIKHAIDYIQGLNMVSSMRLCSNVTSQFAIKSAIKGIQSIDSLITGDGRLNQQRLTTYHMINNIPGLSVTKPQGALYSFIKVDKKRFNITNDELMVLDLLKQQQILVVHGTGFNWPDVDHFRLVYLPQKSVLEQAIDRIAEFFNHYQQKL